MRYESSGSVKIFSIDREDVERAVREWVDHLRARHPEIERIIWFGSWVTGRPTPRSDVDICLVLSSSPDRFRDRIPKYLPDRFPVSVDLHPFTREEFDQLQEEAPQLRAAIAAGREI